MACRFKSGPGHHSESHRILKMKKLVKENEKVISLCHLESPLQLISASPFILRQEECVLIINGNSHQLVNIVKKKFSSKKIHIKMYKTFFGFLFTIIHTKLKYSFKFIASGDIRYIKNIIFLILFINKDIHLVDDGNFNLDLDAMDEHIPRPNINFYYFKIPIIKWILSHKIVRETIFKHNIKRTYLKIIRNDLEKIISSISDIDRENICFKEPCLYFIESSLEGIIKEVEEKEIFRILDDYASKKSLKIKVVTHRLSDTERINSLCDDIKEVEILKLDFPIEFYISDMNPKKDEIIFSFTTAFFTCSILTESFNVSVLDLTGFSISEKWVPMYRRFANDVDQRIHENNKLKKFR